MASTFRRPSIRVFAVPAPSEIRTYLVATLGAELLLHLAHDPRRSVAGRVYAGVRAEADPNRAFEKPPPGNFHAAFDRSGVDRRSAAIGVRQGNLGLSPRGLLPLRLYFWLASGSTIGIMPPSV
jgi:hypothetical protein